MKYATRMILVPEDLYHSLLNNKKQPHRHHSLPPSATTTTTHAAVNEPPANYVTAETPEDPHIGAVATTLAAVRRDRRLNADAKQIHYNRQQKFLQKLLADKEAHPQPVELNEGALSRLASTAAAAAATTTAQEPKKTARVKKEPTTSSSTPHRTRRRRGVESSDDDQTSANGGESSAYETPENANDSSFRPPTSGSAGSSSTSPIAERTSPPMTRQRKRNKEEEEPESNDEKLARLLDYCRKNREQFRVNEKDQVLVSPRNSAMSGSNLKKILKFALAPVGNAPAGYALLLARLKEDNYVRQALGMNVRSKPSSNTYNGSGVVDDDTSTFGCMKVHQGRRHAAASSTTTTTSFARFRPDLW